MGKCFSVCIGSGSRVHKNCKVVQVQHSGASSGLVKVGHSKRHQLQQQQSSSLRNSTVLSSPPPSQALVTHVDNYTPQSSQVSEECVQLLHTQAAVATQPESGDTHRPTSNGSRMPFRSSRQRASGTSSRCSRSGTNPFVVPDSSSSSGGAEVTSSSKRRCVTRGTFEDNVHAMFKRYRDPSNSDMEIMTVDGVIQFLADLPLDPEDFRVLVFAWKCQARCMCQFTWEEFWNGCHVLRADSNNCIVERLSGAVTEIMSKPDDFQRIYRWSFDYALEMDKRSLLKEHAIAMWRVLFSVFQPPVVIRWLDFLTNQSSCQVIPRDTWLMFIKFVENVGLDFSQYTESDAWPTLMDEFVEHELETANRC